MAHFIDVFGEYLPDSPADPIAGAEISRVQIDGSKRVVRIQLMPEGRVPYAELSQLQRTLASALQVQEVELCPHYPPALFTCDYLPEIIARLGGSGVPVNGFFDGCGSDLMDGTLRIYLTHGGKEFLEEIHCPRKISDVIYAEFGREIKVEFDGDRKSVV